MVCNSEVIRHLYQVYAPTTESVEVFMWSTNRELGQLLFIKKKY